MYSANVSVPTDLNNVPIPFKYSMTGPVNVNVLIFPRDADTRLKPLTTIPASADALEL